MYETADMNRGNSEVFALFREMRNLPDDVSSVEDDWGTRTCTYVYKNGRRETHSIDSIIGKRTQAAPKAPAMTKAPVITKAPVKAPTRAKKDDSISKRLMATANKCDEGTRQFKDKIAQIDRDIIALSMNGMKSENYDAIVALKQEKEDLQSRCAKLQQIKTRCLKEAV